MIEKSNPSTGRRQDEDLLRRSRFGNNGFRRGIGSFDPSARPVMEQVSSGSDTPDNGDGGEEFAARRLAMAYIPKQAWRNVLSLESALMNGTIFRELVLPFEGRSVRRR